MTKNLYLFLILILFFINCEKKELNTNQKSLVVKNSTLNTSLPLLKIKNYRVLIKKVQNHKELITLRRIQNYDDKIFYLTLNLNTLKTNILSSEQVSVTNFDEADFKHTNYYKIKELAKSKNNSWTGIDQFNVDHHVLTLDLCPSKKKTDMKFLDFLQKSKIDFFYLAVSGKWILDHQDDLNLIQKKFKNVFWINHSFNHYYDPKKENNENFMLSKGTDLQVEVLQNEKTMLENDIMPSPFFRFPGLVANKELYFKVLSYGVIPIGSNAWLAKGQKISKGSVVLLHANGNEPQGLKTYSDFFNKTKQTPQIVQ